VSRISTQLDAQYNRVVSIALIQILVCGVLAALVLDMGETWRRFLILVIVYLILVGTAAVFQPTKPNPRTLKFLKFVFPFMFIVTLVLGAFR
jgi:hypothetical protein